MKIDIVPLRVPLRRAEGQGVALDNPSRRAVLGALLAGAAAAGAWTTASAAAALQAAGAPAPAASAGLTAAEMKTLAKAADTIVPPTDTPGAVAAGVPKFINALSKHWMRPEELAQFREGLAGLDASARQRFKRRFAQCSPKQAAGILQDLRASSPYQGRTFDLVARILDPKAPFYLRLRDLVVFGYFTSEAGSTKELRYMPVPGRFDGDVATTAWPYQVVI